MGVYDSIIKGINEAIQYEKGELKAAKSRHIYIAALPQFHGTKIREIRLKQNMTQKSLAAVLGVSIKTVEAWEAGKNIPEGPAQRLLDLIDKDENFLEKNGIMSRK